MVAIGTLLAAATASLAVAFPAVAATTCPGCFGMDEVEPGIYTQPAATPEQSQALVSPRGMDVGILAHEMSHVELHQRLGGAHAGVPQWFDEGLAVVAGDDRRYIGAAGSADRCLVRPDGPLPVSLEDWLRAASANADVYAEAACAVSEWLVRYESPEQATGHLIDRLREGESFASLLE